MLTTLITLAMLGAGQDTITLHPITTGAMKKVGFYVPQQLALSSTAPATFKNIPAGAVRYGTWSFGGKSYPVIEVAKDGKPTAIDLDTTGTGDFASATAFSYKTRALDPSKPTGLQLYSAELTAPSPIGAGQPVTVEVYRFDPADTQRAALKDMLLYYGNYGLEGTANLGGHEYNVMLVDTMSAGSFGVTPKTPIKGLSATMLLIDRDGDGKFKPQYESYDATQPFNIGGTTYKLNGAVGDGSHVTVAKSSVVVAEVPIPASFGVGKKVVAFTAVDRSGKTVHFPEDFKGKVVMLDFWATWCGPCMGEVPNVVATYNQLHSQGFEILGVSLDNAQTITKIGPVTKDKGMTWDQIADGKYWDAAIAKLYNVQAIPAAYLVDGDTGMIYAAGDDIRGEALAPAIKKALASKKTPPTNK